MAISLSVVAGRGNVTTGLTINAVAVRNRLGKLWRAYPLLAERSLNIEGEIEMAEAKRRTPVDTGALRSSGRARPPERTRFGGQTVEQRLTFGGPAVGYALAVHENLGAFHRVGQAKYLESVVRESRPFMGGRVTKRILSELRGVR